MIFGRNILDLLHPQEDKTDTKESEEINSCQFQVGNFVWSRNYHKNVKWLPGEIAKNFGSRHYEVIMMVADQTHKCNIDQLRSRQVQSGNEEGKMMSEEFYSFPSSFQNV